MNKIIAIRREDKNEWERRTPLIPEHVKELKEKHGITTIVQPSKIRVFSDDDYRGAGAEISEDISRAGVVFAVKEIPNHLFEKGKAYVFFSHTIKGQCYNMPMLKTMIDRQSTLIDYERIVDHQNRRLIFFGRYAGIAGMFETLFAYGQKMKLLGHRTPFERVKQPYRYESLEEGKQEIAAIGREIEQEGLPVEMSPLITGFTGYGNVSRGAQEIFDLLPHDLIEAETLLKNPEAILSENKKLFKIVFHEKDIVKAKTGSFDLQDYYKRPEKYESKFEGYLPRLGMLINCIYWTEKYPRLVTKDYLKTDIARDPGFKLKVIGDISCDIDGSIEITSKATRPDSPAITYFPGTDSDNDGIHPEGVTVMAVDNLPCEFPREASTGFSNLLKDLAAGIAAADFSQPLEDTAIADPARRAVVLQNGKFTPDYHYMEDFIK